MCIAALSCVCVLMVSEYSVLHSVNSGSIDSYKYMFVVLCSVLQMSTVNTTIFAKCMFV